MEINEFMDNLKPSIVYVQYRNNGIGELYYNGQRVYGLNSIDIHAKTRTATENPYFTMELKRVKRPGKQEVEFPSGFGKTSIKEEIITTDNE